MYTVVLQPESKARFTWGRCGQHTASLGAEPQTAGGRAAARPQRAQPGEVRAPRYRRRRGNGWARRSAGESAGAEVRLNSPAPTGLPQRAWGRTARPGRLGPLACGGSASRAGARGGASLARGVFACHRRHWHCRARKLAAAGEAGRGRAVDRPAGRDPDGSAVTARPFPP